MPNLTVNNGGVITTSNNLPNIDLRYGPYDSIEDAYGRLGQSLVPGLVVGIVDSNGLITDYQAQWGENNKIELTPKLKLKTINNQSIIGEGNIDAIGGDVSVDTSDLAHASDIINNLEDGGVTKMLSAEQGKIIKEWIQDVIVYSESSSDFLNDFPSAYKGTIFKATSNSSYITSGHYYWYDDIAPYNATYFRCIPVGDSEGSIASEGSTIILTANENYGVRYALLTAKPPSNPTGYVDAAETLLTTPTTSNKKATVTVNVLEGAKYLYVETTGIYNNNNVVRTPELLVVKKNMSGYNVNDVIREVEGKILDKIEEEKTDIQENSVGNLFIEIGLDFPGKMGYIKSNKGTWQWLVGDAVSYRHYIVPCAAGDIFRLTSNGYNGARYVFLTETPEYSNISYKNITGSNANANFKFASGYSNGIVITVAGETTELVAPSNAKCLYIYAGYNDNGHAYTPYKLTKKVSIEDYVKARGTERDILDQYPDFEILPILKQLASNYQENSSNIQRTYGCIMFGHITDCHGQDNLESNNNITAAVSDRYSWERFIQLMMHLKSLNEVGSQLNKVHYVDDIVDTGDIVAEYLQKSSGSAENVSMAWRRLGAGEVLTVLGNHDTSAYSKSDGVAFAGTERAYNAFLKNNIENWGVQQPSNAEENHYCYYSKDYIKGVNKLRALFIDYNDWRVNGSASDYHQAAWVETQLEDALTEEMSVVIFTHDVPGVISGKESVEKFAVKSPFTFFSTSSNYGYNDTNYVYLAKLVYNFQQDGGKFVGYITGHSHSGGIGYIAGRYDSDTFIAPYTQMYYCGAYANVRLRGDSSTFSRVLRDPYSKSHDLFRIIAIDVKNSIIKILNFGAEYNYKGQRRGIIALKYNTAPHEEFDRTRVYDNGTIIAYLTEESDRISDCRLYRIESIATTTITAEGNEDTSLPTGWTEKENDPTRWIDVQGNEHYAWVNSERTVIDWERSIKTLYDPDVVISD